MVQELLTAKNSAVVTVDPAMTLADASRIMVEHEIGAIVVTDSSGDIAGILTERDLTKAIHLHGAQVVDQHVKDVMTNPVVTCPPSESVIEVLYIMNARHIRHIAVADKGKLVGMVSIRDVTAKWIEMLELENKQMHEPVPA
jgi:CBS domain-containing protein